MPALLTYRLWQPSL